MELFVKIPVIWPQVTLQVLWKLEQHGSFDVETRIEQIILIDQLNNLQKRFYKNRPRTAYLDVKRFLIEVVRGPVDFGNFCDWITEDIIKSWR